MRKINFAYFKIVMRPPKITQQFIIARVNEIMLELDRSVLAIDHWAIKLTKVSISTTTKSYGDASAKGVLRINRVFINTDEFDALDDIIRHELAHFAVGLNHHHNRVWKRVAAAFGCDITKATHKAGKARLSSTIEHKYWLVAITGQGPVEIKPANSKHKIYTEYQPERKRLLVDGQEILRFEYIPYYQLEDA